MSSLDSKFKNLFICVYLLKLIVLLFAIWSKRIKPAYHNVWLVNVRIIVWPTLKYWAINMVILFKMLYIHCLITDVPDIYKSA